MMKKNNNKLIKWKMIITKKMTKMEMIHNQENLVVNQINHQRNLQKIRRKIKHKII